MLTALLLGPIVLGAVIDVRTRRIPNWLTLGTMAAALVAGIVDGHALSTAGGALAAGGLALVAAVAARGAFGMGDVKLLAAGGAVVGIERVTALVLITAVAGGMLALVLLLLYRRRDVTMPYGPAIACGSTLAFLLA